MTPEDDPGWPVRWTSIVAAFIPGGALWSRRSATDPLVALRSLFLSYSVALVWIFFVSLFVSPTLEPHSPWSAAAAVVVWSIGSHVTARAISKPLVCADEAALRASYSTRFFLWTAFYERAALVGFAAALLTGHAWIYVRGALSTAAGFVRAAPTRRNLEADQQRLRDDGCALSLVRVLRARDT